MATVVVIQPAAQPARRDARAAELSGGALLWISALTVFAVAVHGYHPYAEDGGLYAAGVKRLLDPGLYARGAEFVVAPTRHSLFAPAVAALVRTSGVGLPMVLLALHLASVWATLLAAWLLAAQCWRSRRACAGAVALLACWLGLPVAGIALLLMDPYVTARSVSTPCELLALWGVLAWTGRDSQRRGVGASVWLLSLAVAAAMHPLMAGYALGGSLVLLCLRSERPAVQVWGPVALGAGALVTAAMLSGWAPAETSDYQRIALTRAYWYLGEWRWYEVAGLLSPLGILVWFGVVRGEGGMSRQASAARTLAQAAAVAGCCAAAVAVVFARAGTPTHLVARMQPLRMFHLCYLVMVLLLGGSLGERMLRRAAWRWAALLVLLGTTMGMAARAAYPGSRAVELPWSSPRNPWVQAFVWIRQNTPRDALFALNPDYINAPGEDAQCFRAIAERGALADYSKDGGEASIVPSLTGSWVAGQAAQQRLSAEDDTARRRALAPRGVSWVVLDRAARTSLACPYRNGAVQVCRLATPGR